MRRSAASLRSMGWTTKKSELRGAGHDTYFCPGLCSGGGVIRTLPLCRNTQRTASLLSSRRHSPASSLFGSLATKPPSLVLGVLKRRRFRTPVTYPSEHIEHIVSRDLSLRTKKRGWLTAILSLLRGASRNRTGDEGFADPRLTSWLRRLFSTLVYYSRLHSEKQH